MRIIPLAGLICFVRYSEMRRTIFQPRQEM